MPLEKIHEYHATNGTTGFWLHAIHLRNAYLVLITDDADGRQGLGNVAVCAPTLLEKKPIVSSSIPFINFKYEILAKSISELLGKRLGTGIFLFLDVHFESTDSKQVRALHRAVEEFCRIILEDREEQA